MNVIVTYVPAGAGHEKAAEAVFAALRQKSAETKTVLLNALDGMSAWYQWSFTQGYLGLVHRYPLLWGAAYHLLDLRGLAWAAYRLHRLSNTSHGKILENIFLRQKPDVIIGTHFFPMEVAAYLKCSGRINARLITVLTDFLPHSVWISPCVDTYVIGSSAGREELLERGVSKQRIHLLGIPIDPKFSKPLNKSELQQRLGLRTDRFTVLVCSGGFGTGPMAELVQALNRVRTPLQILVVTGKNSALLRRLESAQEPTPHALQLYGFIDNMEELMTVSDLMITKPGGLSSAEAMAKGLPLLLVAPIPGQETRNARTLCRQRIAMLARNLREYPGIVQQLCQDPGRLQEMARLGKAASFPDAADSVARLVYP